MFTVGVFTVNSTDLSLGTVRCSFFSSLEQINSLKSHNAQKSKYNVKKGSFFVLITKEGAGRTICEAIHIIIYTWPFSVLLFRSMFVPHFSTIAALPEG